MVSDDIIQEVQEFIEDNLKAICIEYQNFDELGFLDEDTMPLMFKVRAIFEEIDFKYALTLTEQAISREAVYQLTNRIKK